MKKSPFFKAVKLILLTIFIGLLTFSLSANPGLSCHLEWGSYWGSDCQGDGSCSGTKYNIQTWAIDLGGCAMGCVRGTGYHYCQREPGGGYGDPGFSYCTGSLDDMKSCSSDGETCTLKWGWTCGSIDGGTFTGKYDASNGRCAQCDTTTHVRLKSVKCDTPDDTTQRCEEGCGAAHECDDKPIGWKIGYDSNHKVVFCNGVCQPEVKPCNDYNGDEGCDSGWKCCRATGNCVSPYCGEPEDLRNTCDYTNPLYYRDKCNSNCGFTKDTSVCWNGGDDACSADPLCHNKRVGDPCDGRFCNAQCACPLCTSDADCTGSTKCCITTGKCVSSDDYCGEPGTYNGDTCCGVNCGYGKDYVTTRDGAGRCDCDGYPTPSNCANGVCQNSLYDEACFSKVTCLGNGKWVGDLRYEPSCSPFYDPCKTLLNLTSAFGRCDNPKYEPAGDVNKDGIINFTDQILVIKNYYINKEWCFDRLKERSIDPCPYNELRVEKPYKLYCYHGASKVCTASGWECTYSTSNCEYETCGEGYYVTDKTCHYGLGCGNAGWEESTCSLMDGCDGDVGKVDGSCAPTGCVFKTFDCDYFSGPSQEGSYEGAYVVYDYYCINGQCVGNRTYDSLITFVSVNDKPACSLVDINGDGKVDIKDLVLVSKYYGAVIGSAKWNEAMSLGLKPDVNSDDKVDIKDLVLVIKNYGKYC
jgi:hypothetical protein